ncbi:protein iws1 homolog [Stylonychia lemnae]|uniref:Protein iws1 homolog n=1 Tax=Stylonychia lemnae TaxID=5949 RepID=A0A077ZQI7_STYLE|nr:protein iws1 homolog [Stylonychia lemnae]|eukprot:CDW71719.1 protein iws1 homolog [Stylonychia lemnae]
MYILEEKLMSDYLNQTAQFSAENEGRHQIAQNISGLNDQGLAIQNQRSGENEAKKSKSKKDKKHKRNKKDKKSKKRKDREEDSLLDNEDDISVLEAQIQRLQQLEEQDLAFRTNPCYQEDDPASEPFAYSDDYELDADGQGGKNNRNKRKGMEHKEKTLKKRMIKHMEKQAQEQEETQKLSSFNEIQKQTYQKLKKKTADSQAQDGDDLNEDKIQSDIARALLEKMQRAYELDRECYRQGKPGLQKLMMAKEVYEQLRKINIQENFLEQGGCHVLGCWLDMLPDGTFPNFNLVNGLLNCISTLKIYTNQLEESGLAQKVQLYEQGASKQAELQRLAKHIIDKWSRQLYQINQEYDAEGNFDKTYRNYQAKMIKRKQKVISNLQPEHDSEDEPAQNDIQDKSTEQALKKKKHAEDEEKKEITRGRMGIMLPERNAFDFVVRPDARDVQLKDKKKDETGKQKLQKTLLQLKKQNIKPTSTKGMATVKMSY